MFQLKKVSEQDYLIYHIGAVCKTFGNCSRCPLNSKNDIIPYTCYMIGGNTSEIVSSVEDLLIKEFSWSCFQKYIKNMRKRIKHYFPFGSLTPADEREVVKSDKANVYV